MQIELFVADIIKSKKWTFNLKAGFIKPIFILNIRQTGKNLVWVKFNFI